MNIPLLFLILRIENSFKKLILSPQAFSSFPPSALMTTTPPSDLILSVACSQNKSLDQMGIIDCLVHSLKGIDAATKVKLLRSVQIREMSSSTYLGDGLAIPHARMEDIEKLEIAVTYSQEGINWPSSEDKAHLIVLFAVPHTYVQAYLIFMKKFVTWYSGLTEETRAQRWAQQELLEEDLKKMLEC